MRIGKKRGRGVYMDKDELACRYHETSSLHSLKYLLKNDKDALLRIMSSIKRAILEEEAKCLAGQLINKVKK